MSTTLYSGNAPASNEKAYAREVIAAMRDGTYSGHDESKAGEYNDMLRMLRKGYTPDNAELVDTTLNALAAKYSNNTTLTGFIKEALGVEQVSTPSTRFAFHNDDYYENMGKKNYLIPGFVPENEITMLFGKPGGGKSLLAMQWAFHISTGTNWFGRKVAKGAVVYVAAEGGYGIGLRTRAWKAEMALQGVDGTQGNTGVHWLDKPVQLNDKAETAEFIAAVQQQVCAIKPVLVVFDTLSRCTAGADENSNSEMNMVLGAADVIKEQVGCAVLIVHHDGKAENSKGPRGAQTLIGNVESALSVTPVGDGIGSNKVCKLQILKMKDGRDDLKMTFKLKVFSFDECDPDYTGATLVLGGIEAAEQDAERSLARQQKIVFDALGDNTMKSGDWQQAASIEGVKADTWKKARGTLLSKGLVEKTPSGLYRKVKHVKEPDEQQQAFDLDEEY